MAQRVIQLELMRDGQCTQWGFRLSGGADIKAPLVIQKINMGTPAEGELQKGDVLLSIGGQDARKMSHQKATEVITKAGNNLKFVIARNAFDVFTAPVSPTPSHSLYEHQSGADYLKPLPQTQFHSHSNATAAAPHVIQREDEKVAIASQAYRTLPLITPTLKTTKDMPTGSYLRHNADTSGRTAAKPNDPFMLTKVQEAILEAAISSPRASVNSSRTSTPDIGYQNVLLKQQYNSPINIYSHQAMMETLDAQTKAATNLPKVQTPSKFTPADLTKSPTYQLIQEEELKHQKVVQKDAVETKIHDMQDFPRNEFGDYENIQQSGSFKVLMTTLKSAPRV